MIIDPRKPTKNRIDGIHLIFGEWDHIVTESMYHFQEVGNLLNRFMSRAWKKKNENVQTNVESFKKHTRQVAKQIVEIDQNVKSELLDGVTFDLRKAGGKNSICHQRPLHRHRTVDAFRVSTSNFDDSLDAHSLATVVRRQQAITDASFVCESEFISSWNFDKIMRLPGFVNPFLNTFHTQIAFTHLGAIAKWKQMKR